MTEILEFIRTAAPWIAMGLLTAILCVRGAAEKKHEAGDYGTEGMCLGMCLGTAIGTSFDNAGIGISLGMLIGLAIGICIPKNKEGNGK